MVKNKVKVNLTLRIKIHTRVNLSIINSMAKVDTLLLMEATTMETIKIIRDMEMVY